MAPLRRAVRTPAPACPGNDAAPAPLPPGRAERPASVAGVTPGTPPVWGTAIVPAKGSPPPRHSKGWRLISRCTLRTAPPTRTRVIQIAAQITSRARRCSRAPVSAEGSAVSGAPKTCAHGRPSPRFPARPTRHTTRLPRRPADEENPTPAECADRVELGHDTFAANEDSYARGVARVRDFRNKRNVPTGVLERAEVWRRRFTPSRLCRWRCAGCEAR